MLRTAITSVALAALLLPVTAESSHAATLPGKSVILLGDSVPYGSACGCQAFGNLYARTMSESNRWQVTTTNLARPGAKAGDVRELLNTVAARASLRRASTVVIMVGANDFEDAFTQDQHQICPVGGCYTTPAEKLRLHMIDIVQTIKKIHRTPLSVVVLDYWDVVEDGAAAVRDYGARGQAKSQTATSYADAALGAAAQSTCSSYVSTKVAFRGPHNDLDPTRLLAADGDHPNAAGHAAIARAISRSRPLG